MRDIGDLEKREILQMVPFIDKAEEEALLALLPECRLTRWGECFILSLSSLKSSLKFAASLSGTRQITSNFTNAFQMRFHTMVMVRYAS